MFKMAAISSIDRPVSEESEESPKGKRGQKGGGGRNPLPPGLPRLELPNRLPAGQRSGGAEYFVGFGKLLARGKLVPLTE